MNILHSKIIPELCEENNFKYEKINDYTCIVNGKLVYEFNFECDSSASCLFAKDKSITHLFLEKNNIKSVEHKYISYEDAFKYEFKKDVVIKDISGTCGIDVYLAKNQEQCNTIFRFLMQKGKRICVSPFEQIEKEFRVIMVNFESKFIYSKIRKENQWKHNLMLGAEIEVVNDNDLKAMLSRIAKRVSKLFKLKTCSVDIIQTQDGLKILEVNSGLMMQKLAEKFYEDVKKTYLEVLEIC